MFTPFVSIKTALAALITASVMGAPLPAFSALSRTATSSPAPSATLAQTDGVLVAGLPFRLPIRSSSPFRFGGFARACASVDGAMDVNALQQTFAPVAPPIQAAEDMTTAETPVDQTALAHPTILVRVPDSPGATLTFTLQDEAATTELYMTQFELTGAEKGIVGIQIPATAAPLEVGQTYAWQALLSSSCGPNLGDFRISIGSSLERVELDGQLEAIEQAPMSDRLAMYAEAGIWQETVSTLAALRLENPDDVAMNEAWSSLMQLVELGELAADPILQIHHVE
ncbi:MAG: DUF928 domain-containing protein [Cyanothece sp. SIO2G6]|nr:DUF928 domain-containing protein [Cyanothece sp. SIO2G6]